MSKNLFQIGTIIPMVLQTISKLDLVESLIYLESQICPFLFFAFTYWKPAETSSLVQPPWDHKPLNGSIFVTS